MAKKKTAAKVRSRTPLTADQKRAAEKLFAIWTANKQRLKINQTTVGKRLGITQGAVSQYLRGEIPLNLDATIRFAAVLGVQEESFAPLDVLKKLEAARRGEKRLAELYVPVPFYHHRFAAGSGSSAAGGDPREPLMFRRDWIERECLDPEQLCAVKVHGDSMFPQLSDGDTVLVRGDRTTVESGHVYAIAHGDDLRVKRVFRPKPGFLLLQSDNQGADTSPELLRIGDLDEVSVIGLVWLRIGRVR